MDNINQLVQPELLAMVPVLNFMATELKKREQFSDTRIPATLGGTGVFLGVCYELASVPITNWQSVFGIIFTGVTQGLLCAASAVYLHQLLRQKEKETETAEKAQPEAKAAGETSAADHAQKPARVAHDADNTPKAPPAVPPQ